MKLGCPLVVLLLVSVAGCAGAPQAPLASPTSNVELTSAELRDDDAPPRVGKSQRTDGSVRDDEEGKHERVTHGGIDRKHGGFSGYK